MLFLVSAFAFQFITNALALSEVRLFPGNGESFLGTGSETGWRNVVSIILLPVKVVLIGPLIPFINFLGKGRIRRSRFFLSGSHSTGLCLPWLFIISLVK